MPATLENLEALKNWTEYRTFMKERLKMVPASDCPVYVSKEKVDFQIDGKPWRGFAFLAGPKGQIAAKKIKKEGVLWREATASLQSKEFTIEGLSPQHLKQVGLTLKKLKLGYTVAGGGEGEEEAGPDPQAVTAAQNRVKALADAVKRAAAAGVPRNDPALKEAATLAQEAQRLSSQDPERAEQLLVLGESKVQDAENAAEAAAETQGEAAEYQTRQQEAVDAIRDAAKLRVASNDDLLKQAAGEAKNAEKSIQKEDFSTADRQLTTIEDLLAQVEEGPEPGDDEEVELAGLADWATYRKFLKLELKRMPPEGGAFYMSRKKVEFDVGGKPYKAFAVLLGKESKLKPTVQTLKKEGTLLFEGSVRQEGKTLLVSGIQPEFIKGAIKLFMKLRLGRKIRLDQQPEGAASQTAPAEAPEGEVSAELKQAILDQAAAWQRIAVDVDKQVAGLKSQLKSSGDEDLIEIANVGLTGLTDVPRRPLMDAIESLKKASDANLRAAIAKTQRALTAYSRYLESDERIEACENNPFGVQVPVRRTLTPALAQFERVLTQAG